MHKRKVILWICGLPNELRLEIGRLCDRETPAWSWILGHFPAPADYDMHVICPVVGLKKNEIDFEWGGAHWHCVRQCRYELIFLWIRFYFSVRTLVRKINPDIVHGWGGELGGGLLATYCSRKSIVSVQGVLQMLVQNMQRHGLEVRKLRSLRSVLTRLSERLTYARAYQLLTESNASHDSLLEFYGKESEIVWQPLRKEFLEFSPSNDKPGVPAFVYVGEMINRKGTMDVLQAFKEIKSKDAQLVMIGGGVLSDAVDAFIQRHELGGRVRHIVNLSAEEIIKEFNSAQFFILPSYGDTGPTAVKEALAQGLYPICYDNTGPKELITRYCGSLVPTGDVKGLTKAMEDAAVRMSECGEKALRASARIRKDMSSESVWNILQKQYRIILNEN